MMDSLRLQFYPMRLAGRDRKISDSHRKGYCCPMCRVWEWCILDDVDRVKRIWYLSPMRAAKVQASLRIRAVSPEPSLLAHTGSDSRRTFRQKARSLAPLNGWACAVKICHDGMLEDTNSLDGAHVITDQDFHQQCPLSRSNNRDKIIINKWQKREREYQCGIRTRDFQAQKRSYHFSVLSPRLTWKL